MRALLWLLGCCMVLWVGQEDSSVELRMPERPVSMTFRSTPASAPGYLTPGFYEGAYVDGVAWILQPQGLYRSDDDGESWTLIAPSDEDRSRVGSDAWLGARIAFVSKNRGWLSLFPEGTWQTDDGGFTWKKLTQAALERMVFHTAEQGWVAVFFPEIVRGVIQGGKAYNYRTVDGGRVWRLCSNLADGISEVFFLDSQMGWGIIERGRRLDPERRVSVLQTKDGGCTWNTLWSRIEETESYGDIFFFDANRGWMAGSHAGELLRTIDGGGTWTSLPLPGAINIAGDFQIAAVHFTNPMSGWIIAVQLRDEDSGLYSTCDGGRSWQAISTTAITEVDLPRSWAPGKLLQALYRGQRR